MRKTIDSSFIEDSSYLLSQTPPNFVEENYYLKSLQDKVDADWEYRPNRKWIEQEVRVGSEEYIPIDVVVQTIHTNVSGGTDDDMYRIVFRDCSKRHRIGERYRFGFGFDSNIPPHLKNVWIGIDQTLLSPTSAQTIQRCNGTIASIYTTEDGRNVVHYEPVIQSNILSDANIVENSLANSVGGHITIVAQHNKFTKQYYVNQRFVIGYDKVYKIDNIYKGNSLSTYRPDDVGIVRIHLSQDQIGELDNFETRLAYNGVIDEPVKPDIKGFYALKILEPQNISTFLTPEGITFLPQVLLGDMPQSYDVEVTAKLGGAYASQADFDEYCSLTPLEDGYYSLKRLKENLALSVIVECTAQVGMQELKLNFEMQLRDF